MDLLAPFRNRQARAPDPEVATLRAEVAALVAEVRALKLEWAEASDRLYRWMKRGEAAARRVEGAAAEEESRAQQSLLPDIPASTPLAVGGSRLWGARARRAARAQAAGAVNGGGSEGE